jgi:hypothetical protein
LVHAHARWKVRFETPAAAYDVADRVLEENDEVVFVYQCVKLRVFRVKGDKIARTSYLGCEGYHLTKRPRPMTGALGIAYWRLGDSTAATIERYETRKRIQRELFLPPAPPLEIVS